MDNVQNYATYTERVGCNGFRSYWVCENLLRSLHGYDSVLSRIMPVILTDNFATSIVLSHEQNSYSSARKIALPLGKLTWKQRLAFS
jgi:hypothetical protein